MLNEGNKHEILQAAQEMRHWAESLETLVEMGKGSAIIANEIAGARVVVSRGLDRVEALLRQA